MPSSRVNYVTDYSNVLENIKNENALSSWSLPLSVRCAQDTPRLDKRVFLNPETTVNSVKRSVDSPSFLYPLFVLSSLHHHTH